MSKRKASIGALEQGLALPDPPAVNAGLAAGVAVLRNTARDTYGCRCTVISMASALAPGSHRRGRAKACGT